MRGASKSLSGSKFSKENSLLGKLKNAIHELIFAFLQVEANFVVDAAAFLSRAAATQQPQTHLNLKVVQRRGRMGGYA